MAIIGEVERSGKLDATSLNVVKEVGATAVVSAFLTIVGWSGVIDQAHTLLSAASAAKRASLGVKMMQLLVDPPYMEEAPEPPAPGFRRAPSRGRGRGRRGGFQARGRALLPPTPNAVGEGDFA